MNETRQERKLDLVERYIHEIGRRLPPKQRADVEAELRSLSMDALEARRAEAADETPEAAQVAVLQELGAPAEVARRYAAAPRYLIGPRVYDTYLRVAGIVLGAVALGLTISTVVSLWETAPESINILAVFGGLIVQYLGAAASALGFTTLIFAILERTLSEKALADLEDEEKWDPRKLPPVEDPNRIQPASMIVSICFTILALLLFNLFADRLGIIYTQTEGGWKVIPMLSPTALKTFLPLWNLSCVLTLALDVAVLQQRQWNTTTRLLELGLKGFTLYILVRMLSGPVLWKPFEMAVIEQVLTQVYRWALIFGIIGTLVEIAQSGYRLIRQR